MLKSPDKIIYPSLAPNVLFISLIKSGSVYITKYHLHSILRGIYANYLPFFVLKFSRQYKTKIFIDLDWFCPDYRKLEIWQTRHWKQFSVWNEPQPLIHSHSPTQLIERTQTWLGYKSDAACKWLPQLWVTRPPGLSTGPNCYIMLLYVYLSAHFLCYIGPLISVAEVVANSSLATHSVPFGLFGMPEREREEDRDLWRQFHDPVKGIQWNYSPFQRGFCSHKTCFTYGL